MSFWRRKTHSKPQIMTAEERLSTAEFPVLTSDIRLLNSSDFWILSCDFWVLTSNFGHLTCELRLPTSDFRPLCWNFWVKHNFFGYCHLCHDVCCCIRNIKFNIGYSTCDFCNPVCFLFLLKWVFPSRVFACDDFTCANLLYLMLSVFWVPRGYPQHRDLQITVTSVAWRY